MANIIKIKRSQVTATPASLAEGELAYSEQSDTLFIGTSGNNVTAIAGQSAMGDDFSKISVSGQSDIEADQSGDTLNFANGTGISITTDAGTDTLTITNSSPNIVTDLSLGTSTSTTLDINSSDGANVTIPAATTNEAGLLTTTQFDKLAYITVTQAVDLDTISDNEHLAASINATNANGLSIDASAQEISLAVADSTTTGALSSTDWNTFNNKSDTDGTVTSITSGNGMNFTTITDTGSIELGTPTTLDDTTTNSVTATSHTHAITGFVPTSYLDTDPDLTADSDTKVATQKATKAYVDSKTGTGSGLQVEVDNIETGAGLNTDGTYTADAGSNYISSATSLKNADSLLDAEIKSNADDILLKLNKAGDTMSGNLVMGGNLVTGLGTPTNDNDATSKSYVDAKIAGLSWKNTVRVASTANFDITTGGLSTSIDGVTVVAGDRVLLMNQTDASENGIYVAASGAWSRATDFDSLTPIDEINGAAVYVEEGSTYSDNGYTVSSQVNTLDTDDIIFTQFNGAAAVTAGIGLGKTGNTLYVNLGAGIVELPSDEVGIDVYPNGGLITTSDGSTSSTASGAQLAILLDGTSLSMGANGLKVSATVLSDIDSKVEGPTSATDGNVVVFDGTTGKLIKDSGSTISGTNTGDVTLANTNYLTISGQVITANTVGAAYGGTGLTSYTVGDIIYASGSTTLSQLSAVATGNVLISAGVNTAPSWGQVDLTTSVTGTLPVPSGGTGATSFTSNGIVYGNGTSALQVTAAGTWDNTNSVGQILSVDSNNVPTWTNVVDGGSF
jgi:hypothetical protein